MYNKFTRKVINQVTAKLNEIFHTNIRQTDIQMDGRINGQTNHINIVQKKIQIKKYALIPEIYIKNEKHDFFS